MVLCEMFRISKSIETEGINCCQAVGLGEWDVTTNGYGLSLGDNENVLELDSGDGSTTL